MNNEYLVCGVLMLIVYISAFSVGYTIGYHEGVKDSTEVSITFLKELNEQLRQLNNSAFPQNCDTYKENLWWDTSWMKRIEDNKSKEWIYYSENCTEEQINKFIIGDYYKGAYYFYSYYDDFEGCYMIRRNE